MMNSLPAGLADLLQTNPAATAVVGGIGVAAATSLLRLIRRIRRILWTVTAVAATGTLGLGGAAMLLSSLNTTLLQ